MFTKMREPHHEAQNPSGFKEGGGAAPSHMAGELVSKLTPLLLFASNIKIREAGALPLSGGPACS
jgi:hypothetical protein